MASLTELQNPICLAPGIYTEPIGWDTLGAIWSKSVTLYPHKGNDGAILCQPDKSKQTILNRAGLPSPGIRQFMSKDLVELSKIGPPVWLSLYATVPEELEDLTAYALSAHEAKHISGIELNLSCPNIMKSTYSYEEAKSFICSMMNVINAIRPVETSIKVPPSLSLAAELGALAEACGVTYVTCSNSLRVHRDGEIWGLSGEALSNLSLQTFMAIKGKCSLPTIGCGGVLSKKDADQFLSLGAVAVQVCAGEILQPGFAAELAKEYSVGHSSSNPATRTSTW